MSEARRLAHIERIPIRWGDMGMKRQKAARIPDAIRERLLTARAGP